MKEEYFKIFWYTIAPASFKRKILSRFKRGQRSSFANLLVENSRIPLTTPEQKVNYLYCLIIDVLSIGSVDFLSILKCKTVEDLLHYVYIKSEVHNLPMLARLCLEDVLFTDAKSNVQYAFNNDTNLSHRSTVLTINV